MDEDDARLMERIRQGDGESFGLLYDRTWRWLLEAVIRPRVGPAAAEEVLADTFRTALDKVGAFEWRGVGVLHWLAAIAKRKSLERLRRDGREALRRGDVEDLETLADAAPTAEAEMIRIEGARLLSARIEATLASLPHRYAGVLRMRLIEGVTRTECAERLGVSTPTFDVVLHRATRAFAAAWGKR